MSSLARVLLAFALSLAVVPVARAGEDTRDTARDHYQRGVDLANRGEYQSALDEFDQAYAASPNFAVLYNIGQADVALGRAGQAIAALEQYLKDGGANVPADRREQVVRQIAELESVFAELAVATTPPGADVAIDGTDVGKTPLSHPLRLRAGTHIVWASRSGAAKQTRVVMLSEGQHQSVDISVPDEPAPSAPVVKPATVSPAVPAPIAAPVLVKPFPTGDVLIGAGLAVGGATIGEYFWNRGRLHDYHANEADLATDPSPGRNGRQLANNELAKSIDRASAVTVGLGVATGVLVVSGVAWLLFEPHANIPEQRATRALPDVAVSRNSLTLSWSDTW